MSRSVCFVAEFCSSQVHVWHAMAIWCTDNMSVLSDRMYEVA